MRKFNIRNPWQAGLITATGLSVIAFYANLLSQSGNAEWAFLLLFGAVWWLTAMFWANDGFNEESGMMLSEVMDRNVEYLHNRLISLEKELGQLRTQDASVPAQSPRLPRAPVHKSQLV